MEMKRLRKFLIITFVVTGLAWGSLAIFTKLSLISFTHPIGTILHIIGGFGPTIASLFVLEERLAFKSAVKFVFQYKRKTIVYFWTLAAMAIAVIGISSMEFNSALPFYLIPIIFLQAVFIPFRVQEIHHENGVYYGQILIYLSLGFMPAYLLISVFCCRSLLEIHTF